MIFLQKQAHVHSQHNKNRAHTPSSPLYIPISSPTPDPSASKAGRASKGGLIMSLLLSLLSSPLDGPSFFSSKAKPNSRCQRSGRLL